MSINMLNRLENLNISEECLNDILEMVSREVESQKAEKVLPERRKKVENLQNDIVNAKNREERVAAIKNLGRAQKRVAHAESKVVKEPSKNSSITFSPSSFN